MAVGTLVLTVLLYIIVPKGFFPVQDTGIILGISEAPQSISFPAMAERQQALARVILKDPAVASLSTFIGVDGTNTTLNSGRMLINLKPLAERRISASEVIRRLQPELAELEGITPLHAAGAGPHGGGPGQPHPVPVQPRRPRFDELNGWTPKLVAALQELPELRDVSSDQQDQGLQVYRDHRPRTASRLGITPQTHRRHPVRRLRPAPGLHHLHPAEPVPGHSGGQARVSAEPRQPEGHLHPQHRRRQGAAERHHPGRGDHRARWSSATRGSFPSTTLSFNLAPGVSLGEAVQAIEATTKKLGLPASIRGSFQGTALAFQASLTNEPLLILAALITVYIVLGVLYESYIHPITILSTLPSAGVGAILALLICRTEFSVIALIGIILLIGIVKKNGIMMVDFALEAERKEGKPPEEAIYQACLLRFRPIMMTTMAALLGALPLAIGTGLGSELRHPLGISIVGGLIFSQVLTLYTTPVIYLWFDRLADAHAQERPAEADPGG